MSDIYQLTREGVEQFTKEFPKRRWKINLSQFEELNNYIFSITSFLSSDVSMAERLYCIINGIEEPKLCKYCDRILSFKSFEEGYRTSCKYHITQYHKDNGNYEHSKKKRLETLSKVGEDGLTGNQRLALKSAKTVKETGKIIEMQEKRKHTMTNSIDENGLNVFQRAARNRNNKDAQLKRERHFLSKHGVRNPFQIEEVKQKISKTQIKKAVEGV